MRQLLCFFLIFIPIELLACPAIDPEEERFIPILEGAQKLFNYRLNAVANRMDAFFANQRADDELGRSQLRLRGSYQLREGANGIDDYQIRLNMRLPHLEEKFHRIAEKRKKKRRTYRQEEEIKENESLKSKLNTDWIFRADIGASIKLPLPVLFTRARVRKSFQTGTIIHRFSEQGGYFTDRGLLEETVFDTDQSITDEILFRFSNRKNWDIIRKDFTTSHGPTIFHKISERSAFSYNFIMSTIVDKGIWYINNYQISPAYRRDIYRNWIFMDLIPGLDFPKDQSFRRTPFIIFQIEALFGT